MSEEKTAIYSYTDYRTFLQDYARSRKEQSSHWSLGVWARQLGLSGGAVLTNILNGKRGPGESVQRKFSKYFKFNNKEQEYFSDLIRLQRVSGDPRLSLALMEKMKRIHPQGEFKLLDDQTFSFISKWYYCAIHQMVNLPYFKEDYDWVAKNLNFKVTPREIKKAIDDLLAIDLLARDENGVLRTTHKTLQTTTDIASEGVKRFHEQTLDNAKQAIREIDILERDISGRTFNISEEKMPQAKQYIQEFRSKMAELFEDSSNGSRTYQLSIHMFPLTKKHTNKGV